MKPDPTAAADTRMMGLVHDALRRDLTRARAELTTAPYPRDAQRVAIGEHLGWMMGFLHNHHSGEDDGLWPLVLRRNPSASALLADMDADHTRIAPAVALVESGAGQYGSTASDDARIALLAAIDELEDVLLPHLRREEAEAMPVVSASISQAEWSAWDQEFNIKSKTLTQLGAEGHWLLDGLDPARYRLVTHLVPAVARFILVHGFARRYRRQADARWTGKTPSTAAGRATAELDTA
jgi:hypothetical protein